MKQDDTRRFAKLIEDIDFAMMVTTSADDGSLRSRPMTLQKTEFDGTLWFFSGRSTSQVSDIQEFEKVNLAFSNPKDMSFVSASGSAEIVLDLEKAKELWSPALKTWFPEGFEDPELCLIKVTVDQADYWETPSSKLVQLIGFAKAVVTGQRAGEELGRRGHLN